MQKSTLNLKTQSKISSSQNYFGRISSMNWDGISFWIPSNIGVPLSTTQLRWHQSIFKNRRCAHLASRLRWWNTVSLTGWTIGRSWQPVSWQQQKPKTLLPYCDWKWSLHRSHHMRPKFWKEQGNPEDGWAPFQTPHPDAAWIFKSGAMYFVCGMRVHHTTCRWNVTAVEPSSQLHTL